MGFDVVGELADRCGFQVVGEGAGADAAPIGTEHVAGLPNGPDHVVVSETTGMASASPRFRKRALLSGAAVQQMNARLAFFVELLPYNVLAVDGRSRVVLPRGE